MMLNAMRDEAPGTEEPQRHPTSGGIRSFGIGHLLLLTCLVVLGNGCQAGNTQPRDCGIASGKQLEYWLAHCQPVIDRARTCGDITAAAEVVHDILMFMKAETFVSMYRGGNPSYKGGFVNYVSATAFEFFRNNRNPSSQVARALLEGDYGLDAYDGDLCRERALLLVLILDEKRLIPSVKRVSEQDDSSSWQRVRQGIEYSVHARVRQYAQYVLNALTLEWKVPWGRITVVRPYTPRSGANPAPTTQPAGSVRTQN